MTTYFEKDGIKVGDKVTYKVWDYTVFAIWNDGFINRVELVKTFENGLSDVVRLRLDEVKALKKSI